MNGLLLLIGLMWLQAPNIEIVTQGEKQLQGELQSFSSAAVTIKTDSQTVSTPISEILSIRTSGSTATSADETQIEIRLVDGTQLRAQSFLSSDSTMIVVHPQLGKLQVPASIVSSVRLAPPDRKIDAEWNQLLDRSLKKDMVAFRKGDVLDHLDGVIGSLNETTLQFQLDGDDISVQREKVFGLIYVRRESLSKKAVAQVDLMTGDRMAVKQVTWNKALWKIQLASGLDFDVPPSLLRSIDYSVSKITYLSDLEPRTEKYTNYFGIPDYHVWDYRRDKDFEGNRISLGQKIYAKGLAIHSQTLLKYRLGGEYRRFQAVMGIGDEINRGDVDVVIRGDDKILFSGSAKATEPGEKGTVRRAAPQTLDLDVTGVVELEIFVDFGSDGLDVGDRLYLGNARAVR